MIIYYANIPKLENPPMTPTEQLVGQVCVVTGASGGVGKETARSLADMGATVVLIARDRTSGEAALAELTQSRATGSVELLVGDLSSQAEVRSLASDLLERHARLHVLVNNAGVALSKRRTTVDGLESTLATNHLAPFLLSHLLLDRLRMSAPARIVNVSSHTHTWVRRIPWDDLQSKQTYDPHTVYNLTKLMNILFTYELAQRLTGSGVTANCLHPGWPIRTDLGRQETGLAALFDRASKLFARSAKQGAETSVYLASSVEVGNTNGRYFVNRRPTPSSTLSNDASSAHRLWTASTELCGLSELAPASPPRIALPVT